MRSECVGTENNVQVRGEERGDAPVAICQKRRELSVTVNDNDVYVAGDLVLGASASRDEIESTENISKAAELFAKVLDGVERLVNSISELLKSRSSTIETKKPEVGSPEVKTEEKQSDKVAEAPLDKNKVHPQAPGGGFLWKPISEKDGKLVVLLPKRLNGKIKSVQILAPDTKKVLDKGKFTGIGNQDRSHYRFARAGAQYPDGAIVQITLDNGKIYNQKIKESSARFQK